MNKTYFLLERIINLLRSEERRSGKGHELQPIHLHVLQYLNHANRYSDTPVSVSEYLGITKGTISQSLILLKKRGLIISKSDKKDRRIIHYKLTISGKNIVTKLIPPELFKRAQNKVSKGLETHLEELLNEMQLINSFKTFGVCKTCRFLKSENKSFTCGLTNERLKSHETTLVCREHAEVN